MMDSLICEYKKCTGCAACFSICPKNCITMHADDEGFLRPKIDDSMCINCNRCKDMSINKNLWKTINFHGICCKA
ncbi:MAG: 4Fe-4S dicluster domain-containing protein [Ruminococcus bicirculans (ex Wegman et al. 2014)]